MNRYTTVGLSMLAGAAIGAAAIQALHAQARPLAYNIAEVTVTDQDNYSKEYLPLITKAITDGGGKFLARGGKTVSLTGAPPEPRIVIIQFENMDKLQAFYDSAESKAAQAIGYKYSTQRVFGVEGVPPQ